MLANEHPFLVGSCMYALDNFFFGDASALLVHVCGDGGIINTLAKSPTWDVPRSHGPDAAKLYSLPTQKAGLRYAVLGHGAHSRAKAWRCSAGADQRTNPAGVGLNPSGQAMQGGSGRG